AGSPRTICRNVTHVYATLILIRGASPLGLPYRLARGGPRCPAPLAWLARNARSLHRTSVSLTPLHALSRAASSARFRLRAKRYGETSPKPWRRRAGRVAHSLSFNAVEGEKATNCRIGTSEV